MHYYTLACHHYKNRILYIHAAQNVALKEKWRHSHLDCFHVMLFHGQGARFLFFNRNIKAWFITKSITATAELNQSEWRKNQVTDLRGGKMRREIDGNRWTNSHWAQTSQAFAWWRCQMCLKLLLPVNRILLSQTALHVQQLMSFNGKQVSSRYAFCSMLPVVLFAIKTRVPH